MVEITNLRQGVVLNHNHGEESSNALRIKVEGLSSQGCPVTVNGIPAIMDGRRFTAEIDLTQKINTITANTVTPYGSYSQELTALWDKKSFSDCQVKVKFNPSGNAKGVRALVHDYGCFYANERSAGHPDGSYNILYADMHVETCLATPQKYYKIKTDKGRDFYKDVDQK